ncbi:hypothetical protein H0X06_04985 [Candidatus Dependentiae bacterium]|nr:hypothetical protein [Candidatus Dependentiae bacterium]
MKSHIFLILLCVSAFSVQLQAQRDEKKLVASIKNVDKNQLISLLDTTTLSLETKNRLLKMAKRNIKVRQQNIHLTKSGWDCITFIAGLIGAKSSFWGIVYSLTGAALSAAGVSAALSRKDKRIANTALATALGFTTVTTTTFFASLYLIRKGWRCTNAENILSRAEEIETLIENTPVNT